jgi:hypothetical protein
MTSAARRILIVIFGMGLLAFLIWGLLGLVRHHRKDVTEGAFRMGYS